jgi:DNA-binding response OmpR family regulator
MRVLIADDDRNVVELLAAFVTSCHHEVVATVTGGGLEAMRSFVLHRPDLVILDIMMPKFNGFTVCNQLVSRDPTVKVILMSGLVDQTYPSVASCGAVEYLRKPLHFSVVREMLERLAQITPQPAV